jgi:thioesterase domain-containing protein
VLDNFFEIGGDSLLGVSIFVDIEETFKKTLPLSVLIGSPTIEALASCIDADSNATDWKYLVPIQQSGGERPLFCMHAAGGNVLFYRDLAKELGDDQPVYGLQARGVADKSETAHDRVEDMATAYLAEIRSFQPDGPYRLCGSSFGGLVAFEVAQQLAAVGEEVEVLALFDTYAPGLVTGSVEKQLKSPLLRFHERLRNVSRKFTALPSNKERAEVLGQNLKKLFTQVKRKALWKRNQFALQYSKATGKELPVDLQRNHKAIDKARATYRPQPYQGKLILFRAKDQPAAMASHARLGWDQFTSEKIDVIEVAGAHGALTMYPFASDLAMKFRPFLSREVRPAEQARSVAAFV